MLNCQQEKFTGRGVWRHQRLEDDPPPLSAIGDAKNSVSPILKLRRPSRMNFSTPSFWVHPPTGWDIFESRWNNPSFRPDWLTWFIVDCWHTNAIPVCQGVFMSIQEILISLHICVKWMALEVKPYTSWITKPVTRCDQLIGKALWQRGWILYDIA